ncbi:MAG: polymer-forming cytoskeletal protein [Chloroflexi bacterium]|nr:polymer-forming cytoskeletal protein [Chloroflexota bacterium]MBV9545729.1 polymer-forming cytoskeletal protein [Chloroflexota bacterium]
MFKKSEEQEWTRFRGALSKDRDDAGPNAPMAEPTESTNSATPPAGPAPASQGTGPSFRSGAGDVNVGVPSPRPTRSVVSDSGEVESLIGERTTFEGTLRSDGAIRLLGTVQGEIQSKATIIVEDKAHVTARLTAAQVTVAGQVDGQIYCDGRCEIRPTGRVTGEINAGALIIQEGAYFDGSSKMATSAGSTNSTAATTASPATTAAAGKSSS